MGDLKLSNKQNILSLSLSHFCTFWLGQDGLNFWTVSRVTFIARTPCHLWSGGTMIQIVCQFFMDAISNQEPTIWFWIEMQFQLCWDLPPSCLEIFLYFKTWPPKAVISFWDVNELSRVELNWAFVLLSLAWSQIGLRQAKLSSTVLN